ncbi:hypothetical protein FIT84_04105 [Candidatus Methylopumilus universalis]|nr:hypothetical protein FIT84_04105 [Candidatus Methylopumilus universalis]
MFFLNENILIASLVSFGYLLGRNKTVILFSNLLYSKIVFLIYCLKNPILSIFLGFIFLFIYGGVLNELSSDISLFANPLGTRYEIWIQILTNPHYPKSSPWLIQQGYSNAESFYLNTYISNCILFLPIILMYLSAVFRIKSKFYKLAYFVIPFFYSFIWMMMISLIVKYHIEITKKSNKA